MGKYNNKKTYIGNIKFDSQLEAEYYTYLQENRDKLGICEIELQVPFLLINTIRYNGHTYSKIQYKSDFKVTYINGGIEVLDTKGVETSVFKLKRRLLLERYPNINFYCVKKVKGQWIKY
ncbi:DUF1064 domain-containing protein [Clostridium sp. BL-8]|uniref:DUF1064 domain-containing protein n=1 Tax=Clostridium sp. BL-8 TaxID=349938 RepID=UPI0015C2E09B|nr:DUF1064 domain-containing protein [Clostridium sp. BL-8]